MSQERDTAAMAARHATIGANLAAVRRRIDAACAAAGRDPGEVSLVAVTKFFPAEDVLHLYDHGLRVFGESRDQEAAAKVAEVTAALAARVAGGAANGGPPTWHFIGQVQTNKARSVVSYADVVESVDRLRLVSALDDAARRAHRSPLCLVQVDLDPDAQPDDGAGAGRGGAHPAEVGRIAEAVAGSGALRLGGLMAVAPREVDPGAAFERLAALAGEVRGAHAGAAILSAGMSGDLEAAVTAGATHVRIGSALLGTRPPLR